MSAKYLMTPAALLLALTVGSVPARADERDHNRRDGRHERGHERQEPRGGYRAAPRYERHDWGGRGDWGRREWDRRSYRSYRPWFPTRVYRPFYRPWFSFRPHFSLGFGLSVGYPVPYPSYGVYVDPYAAPAPYGSPYGAVAPGYNAPAYGAPQYGAQQYGAPQYAPQGQVGVAPSSNQYGGLTFSISPGDAAIYVDGEYAGTADSFNSTAAPLTLVPGRHHVVLRADGYRDTEFDADIVAGQVVPYQGSMGQGY